MFQSISNNQNKLTKSMTEKEFEGIIEAILAGKYSWACVLILRVAGYNPLHYIPYRTYNRLIKDNCLAKPKAESQNNKVSTNKSNPNFSKSESKGIRDLSYLEKADHQESQIVGGAKNWWYF